jgi:hypothetical protein
VWSIAGALDLCASRPGEWVTYPEVCEYTGRSRAGIRGDLGELTRLVRKIFGKSSRPFEAPWLPHRNEYGFRMDAEQAAWWTEATSDEATPLPERPLGDRDESGSNSQLSAFQDEG